MSCYIYQLPAWVLDDLCRNMDTLSEWDWMQFASYVITDLTQLRRIRALERVQGVSVTRELLWWWGMRQATVQQLLDLLHRLQLYRAAQIVRNWSPSSETPSLPDPLDSALPGRPSAASVQDTEDGQRHGQSRTPTASQDPGPVVPPGASSPASVEGPLPLKPPSPDSKVSQPCGASTPQQEVLWSQSVDGLFWEDGDVAQATDSFSAQRQLCQGTFADIYWGQRHGTALAFKRLREVPGAGPSAAARFLEAEVQVCRRCCHPNVLPLLGFCPGKRFCTLVYPFMANGSLQDRLQCRAGSAPLPWPQRASVCSGLLRAVGHLHSLGITHGNIRSSNVLLDRALTPKLAHPAKQLCPVHERSGYTLMKTRLFQASAAYLPESALRVGRPTERADIFSCGIVLAEVLTGMPAMDESRSPVYLKDLLLGNIPSSSSSLCSQRKTDAEKALAQELCLRHLDSRAGRLTEDGALGLALAASLCLQRRNPSLAEASDLVANVEMRLRGQEVSMPGGGLSLDTSSSSNTPEETDDVEVLPLGAASARLAPLAGVAPTEGRLQACGPAGADSSSEASVSPNSAQEATSWKIEINEAKRKLMEDIVLYKEDKLDSSELFGF